MEETLWFSSTWHSYLLLQYIALIFALSLPHSLTHSLTLLMRALSVYFWLDSLQSSSSRAISSSSCSAWRSLYSRRQITRARFASSSSCVFSSASSGLASACAGGRAGGQAGE